MRELRNGPEDWHDIKDAADLIWRTSITPEMNHLQSQLRNHYSNPNLSIVALHTGVNAHRKGTVVCNGEKITIALVGSAPDEMIKNTWTHGKGPGWWELPYPRYDKGNRVHSFYLDMWHGMQGTIYSALGAAVQEMETRGVVPKQIIITGFSMGGGVSTLGFMDMVDHIRSTYGSRASSPKLWAIDETIGSLVQHLTFSSFAAADHGYHTILNRVYEEYQIRAWDFMNHVDRTRLFHDFGFRSWRGHRYILPDAVVRHFGNEFGGSGHDILGYLKAAEWMLEHGTDQVKPEYSY